MKPKTVNYTVEAKVALRVPGDVYRIVRVVAADRGISATQLMAIYVRDAAHADAAARKILPTQ